MTSHGKAQGFILVLVLVILVILSILASTVAVTAQRLRDEESDSQRLAQAEVDMADTRASMLYLLLTRRRTFGGLTVDDAVRLSGDEQAIQASGDDVTSLMPTGTEIAMDATPFRGIGAVDFALQDDRGRLAVNWAPGGVVARFVGIDGAIDQGQTSRNVDTLRNLLADYQDADDLYRLNSAERSQYAQQGRPLPTNRSLVTPLELRRVIGWDRALESLSDAELLDSITTVRSAQVNVNTAPEKVLRALPGVDAAMAKRVIDARALQPFTSLSSVYQVLGGVPADEGLLSLYPMDSGTLSLWPREGGPLRVLHWTLTPFNPDGAPWREDYEFALPQDDRPAEGLVHTSAAKVLAGPEDSSP